MRRADIVGATASGRTTESEAPHSRTACERRGPTTREPRLRGEWSGREDCGYWDGASRRCKVDSEVQERSAPRIVVKVRTLWRSLLKPLQSLRYTPVTLALVGIKTGLWTAEFTSFESRQSEPQ